MKTTAETNIPNGADLDYAAVDPFAPEAFRASEQDVGGIVETSLGALRLGKPAKDVFVRAHHDPAYTWPLYVYKPTDGSEPYLLTPDVGRKIQQDESGVIKCVMATLGITRQGDLFLWEWNAVPADGRDNGYWESNRRAVGEGKESWVRVKSNRAAACYDITRASISIPDPTWPDLEMADLVFKTFPENRRIVSENHEVLLRLRGLA